MQTKVLVKTKLKSELQSRIPIKLEGKTEEEEQEEQNIEKIRKEMQASGESFSCNFLSEIPIHMLQKEYNKAIIDAFEYKYDTLQPPQYYKYMQDDYRIYYSNRLNDRVHDIENMLEVYL